MSNRRGLEIRAASAADAPALAELLGSNGHTISAKTLAARLDAVRQGAGTVLIALEWGPPSGVVALHWYVGLDEDRPKAQIDALLVGAEDRRRGIGRLLVKAASQAARVAGCASLALVADPSLQAFYQATGFTEFGLLADRKLRKNSTDP